MACFTPENNAYCLPNVNAFLDTRVEIDLSGGGKANMKGSNSTLSDTFGCHLQYRGFITQLFAKCGILVFGD